MASTVRNQPYVSPTPGEITVVASGIVPDGTYTIDESVFQEIRDCNFNAISLLGSTKPDMSNEVKKSICFALKHDLNILLAGYYLNLHDNGQPDLGLPKAKAYIDLYKGKVGNECEDESVRGKDYVAGWQLKDEPSLDQLNDRTSGKLNLRNIVDYIRNAGDTRPIQINLLGGLDNPADKNDKTYYDKYLDAFNTLGIFKRNNQETRELPLWSYDLYPITQKSCLINETCNLETNCELSINYSQFYKDLANFSKRAKDCGGVFWAHVQSMEYINGTTLHPAALESYMRFEAFSALAYGAQGIIYWAYMQHENNDKETYPSALIDRHRNKFPAWYFARRVNAEIQKYRNIFVGSKLVVAAHVGEIYEGCRVITATFGPLYNLKASGKGFLVSQIQKTGHTYVIFVSHDVENYQTISVSFTAGVKVMEMTPTTSHGKPLTEYLATNVPHTRTLIPGGYIILDCK